MQFLIKRTFTVSFALALYVIDYQERFESSSGDNEPAQCAGFCIYNLGTWNNDIFDLLKQPIDM